MICLWLGNSTCEWLLVNTLMQCEQRCRDGCLCPHSALQASLSADIGPFPQSIPVAVAKRCCCMTASDREDTRMLTGFQEGHVFLVGCWTDASRKPDVLHFLRVHCRQQDSPGIACVSALVEAKQVQSTGGSGCRRLVICLWNATVCFPAKLTALGDSQPATLPAHLCMQLVNI